MILNQSLAGEAELSADISWAGPNSETESGCQELVRTNSLFIMCYPAKMVRHSKRSRFLKMARRITGRLLQGARSRVRIDLMLQLYAIDPGVFIEDHDCDRLISNFSDSTPHRFILSAPGTPTQRWIRDVSKRFGEIEGLGPQALGRLREVLVKLQKDKRIIQASFCESQGPTADTKWLDRYEDRYQI